MKITFCLPSISRKPIGGYKVVFEYANQLVALGHEVNIFFLVDKQLSKITSSNLIKRIIGNIFKRPKWFTLLPQVILKVTPYSDGRDIPKADFVFATAISTVDFVKKLDNTKGRKAYLIQGFENWAMSDEEVRNTYSYGMLNIVVSKWLRDIVVKTDKNVKLISNTIDTNKFYVEKDISSRNPYQLAALYHVDEHKGFPIAFEAIKRVKSQFPELQLALFGVPAEPKFLEDWITYKRAATPLQLKKIYNAASIFVCASINEGFGLTGAESMACGCALASTAYAGVFEYARHNENALLSDINDIDSLTNNIIRLIEDQELRLRIAKQASEDMRGNSWHTNAIKLEQILKNELLGSCGDKYE